MGAAGGTSKWNVDDLERHVLRAEGLDPDPAVLAAIDLVRWERSLGVTD
ncbi:MAG: hypothetical protein QOD88_1967 [Mycobacterium sp.]|jgi:hypothetical protein|nr:hypothetical protein [Mycobacterium sp.]MDT7760757.1 hypothetical protein [Mycobacterium sp.]